MYRTILITGATSGFGEAIARRFAATKQWQLILTGRRQERLESLKKELQTQCEVHCYPLDIRKQTSIDDMIHTLPPTFKNVHTLINNAGLALGTQPADKCDTQDWLTMIDTNIKGLILLTHALLPTLKTSQAGNIINIGSIAATWPYPGGNVYGATKAFVKQFSRNLRCDLLGSGLRVTDVEPGMAETEFSVVRYKGDQQQADKVYENMKPLTANDIAETIFWVANQPPHVNINQIEIMPTQQAWMGMSINRNSD